MAGPLPNPDRRRRNKPTIPTTKLPASGRAGPVPRPPKWVPLERSGSAWWKWAWKTPQAAAWSDGDLQTVARRASLEDDIATISDVESLDLLDVVSQCDPVVKAVIRRLAGLTTGRLAILKEMRELDDRLGLTPKGFAALRWQIVADETETVDGAGDDEMEERVRALYAVKDAG